MAISGKNYWANSMASLNHLCDKKKKKNSLTKIPCKTSLRRKCRFRPSADSAEFSKRQILVLTNEDQIQGSANWPVEATDRSDL